MKILFLSLLFISSCLPCVGIIEDAIVDRPIMDYTITHGERMKTKKDSYKKIEKKNEQQEEKLERKHEKFHDKDRKKQYEKGIEKGRKTKGKCKKS